MKNLEINEGHKAYLFQGDIVVIATTNNTHLGIDIMYKLAT